jgi:DnaK suppressor protein
MKDVMNPENRNRYRKMLMDLHERVGGEVNYVVGSIHEDVDLNANVSSAPVHLADVATEAVDVDVQVLHNERSILEQIDAALQRIADGSFGRCTRCKSAIAEERLNALPYTPVCAQCAQAEGGEE